VAPAIRSALGRPIQFLCQRPAIGPHVCAHLPIPAVLSTGLLQPASLAGEPDTRGGHRLPHPLRQETLNQQFSSGRARARGALPRNFGVHEGAPGVRQ
jgi:hypothetical protein